MKETIVKSFTELHEQIEAYDSQVMIYRGVKSRGFDLIPKIGRLLPSPSTTSPKTNEKEILRLFKERALPYLDFVPESDWDWLSIGQHHGLPTRLLDWSRNPLVACYFAVEEATEDDSVIYAFNKRQYLSTYTYPDPFSYTQVGKFIPRHITTRITAQSGVFTIHSNPYKPFVSDDVDRIIIPNNCRLALKKRLHKYGIDRSSLFPGLDGLASHIQWLRSKGH